MIYKTNTSMSLEGEFAYIERLKEETSYIYESLDIKDKIIRAWRFIVKKLNKMIEAVKRFFSKKTKDKTQEAKEVKDKVNKMDKQEFHNQGPNMELYNFSIDTVDIVSIYNDVIEEYVKDINKPFRGKDIIKDTMDYIGTGFENNDIEKHLFNVLRTDGVPKSMIVDRDMFDDAAKFLANCKVQFIQLSNEYNMMLKKLKESEIMLEYSYPNGNINTTPEILSRITECRFIIEQITKHKSIALNDQLDQASKMINARLDFLKTKNMVNEMTNTDYIGNIELV